MPRYSATSLARLETCHPDLVRLFRIVGREWDCTILCGHRGREEQERLYREGKTRARWGQSAHNAMPSRAVDVWPYPIDWLDEDRARVFAGYVLGLASALGIPLRWGGDWHGELKTRGSSDRRHSFDDLPHFELMQDTEDAP